MNSDPAGEEGGTCVTCQRLRNTKKTQVHLNLVALRDFSALLILDVYVFVKCQTNER